MLHRLHDFRRGHAEVLRRLPSTTLGDILEAGDWSSGAFKDCLDKRSLERDRIVAAHSGGSQFQEPLDSDGESVDDKF